ncbi:MAG: hypothetical protein QOH14_2321 [Pseudonocardiales bacterium]|nr:hypothetical protein [Pseudonocardiales bacterium]
MNSLEYKTLRTLGTLPMIAVALVEETVKMIVPAVALVGSRHRSRADGLLIGVASGAGALGSTTHRLAHHSTETEAASARFGE